MTKVKICGIRNLDDALAAANAGADFIGIVFVPGRPRRVDIPDAAAVVSGIKSARKCNERLAPEVVGLFADQPLGEVNHAIDACGLDLVQLCGQESLSYCDGVNGRVIKVLHVPGGLQSPAPGGGAENPNPGWQELSESVDAYSDAGHLVTLDRLVQGIPGGTGESFNWDVAAALSVRGHSFILAGGLTPDTVGEAVSRVRPWGVDVSSGVETGGVKDHEKIRAFVDNARAAR